MSLTGPLAGTAVMHKLAGEIFVEQLISGENVDLLMGPYATANSLSAMGVAQRNGKILITNSFGIPSLAKYDMHFPAYVMGSDPGTAVPNTLLDAIAAGGAKPQSVAMVTSKFPSVVFLSVGAREVFKKRGLREALWLEWEFGNRDFGPIASHLKEANADMVWINSAIQTIRRIRDRGTSIVFVEQVMSAVLALSDRLVILKQGQVIAEGLPQEVMARPEVAQAYLGV